MVEGDAPLDKRSGSPDPADRFSAATQLALEKAQQEAGSFKHDYVGAEHLLLGLAAVEQGAAAAVLADRGIDYWTLRNTLAPVIGSGQASRPAPLPLTARATTSIELGLREAELSGRAQITTGDVLLGILIERENVAARILGSMDVDVATARSMVREIVERSGGE